MGDGVEVVVEVDEMEVEKEGELVEMAFEGSADEVVVEIIWALLGVLGGLDDDAADNVEYEIAL